MDLAQIIKVLGWVFCITPIAIFIVISTAMIRGAMEDDDLIKSLVMIGLAVFFIGLIMLFLIYLTNIFYSSGQISYL